MKIKTKMSKLHHINDKGDEIQNENMGTEVKKTNNNSESRDEEYNSIITLVLALVIKYVERERDKCDK